VGASERSRAGRPWLTVLLLAFLLVAVTVLNTTLVEVRCIDLTTMERVAVRRWRVFGLNVTRSTERSHTLVSLELAHGGLTTGVSGTVMCDRSSKPLVTVLRGPITGHSVVGRRVLGVANTPEIAEAISRRGDTTLHELARVVREASDMTRYPSWDLSEAVKRVTKTQRESPDSDAKQAP